MAVYTEVTGEALGAFLSDYDLGRVVSLEGIAEGVENTNYLLRTEKGPFMLTLYEKRVKESDLPFFLGLMDHLSDNGLTCPRPVHNRQGAALGRLAGRAAAIVTFLEGHWMRQPKAAHCAQVGEALARMHKAGRGFGVRRANALSVTGWPGLFAAAERRADEVAPGLRGETATELAYLLSRWPKGLPEGVIHADLFPDNVFFVGDKLSGLIDFYFACDDCLAYDLAICLNAWGFEFDGKYDFAKGKAMIAGYQRVRLLKPVEAKALPILARGAALRFMLTRLVDWLNVPPGALVRPKDPLEYLWKLRFHQRVANVAEYGYQP